MATKVIYIKYVPDYLDYFVKRKNKQYEYDMLFAGRLSIEKGVLVLLSALEILKKQGKNYHLLLLGDFPSAQEKIIITDCIRKNNLSSQITIKGFSSDVTEYIVRSRLVVLPSYRETLGLILLEALLLGRPVIGSRVGDIEDFIQDDFNGKLFTAGEDKELADAIRAILSEHLFDKYLKNAGHSSDQLSMYQYNYSLIEQKIIDAQY